MISVYALLAVAVAYFAALGAVGVWAERRAARGHDPTQNGWMYALALTVYCSSWTYYGSVGSAANNGLLYVAIYLGPTLVMLCAWGLLRRVIRLRREYNFSSVADLLTMRYGRSVRLGAFITAVLLLGMLPYIGLQIRAVIESFTLLTGLHHNAQTFRLGHYADELMVVMIGVITIVFGLRRVDTRRRQSGLIAILAVEALTKLVAFLVAGGFVVWGLFGGIGDLAMQVSDDVILNLRFGGDWSGKQYLSWMTYLFLSMGAVVLLPRMFHVMVVENTDERHLTTAMWLFPLYMLLISLFVVPIAMGGQLLKYPASEADWFVLRLPFDQGQQALAVLVYLGGVASSVGMVMVACTTMAIMFSNHIVLPALARLGRGRGSGRQVLWLRWFIVFVMILASYVFEQGLANSYFLIQMGLISFASVAQFVPALLGALYWRGSSTRGAWWGLIAGWTVWAYTLFIPAAVRGGLGDVGWLSTGPWNLAVLQPETLFGLDLGTPLVNGVFWSLLFNVIAFFVGSATAADEDDPVIGRYLGRAERFPGLRLLETDASIDFGRVLRDAMALILRFLPRDEAEPTLTRLLTDARLADHDGWISSGQFMQFSRALEIALAGVIGAALARQVVAQGIELTADERASLQYSYAEVLAEMRITPAELRQRIDYLREQHEQSLQQAEVLQEKVEERTQELALALEKAQEGEQTIKRITQSMRDAVIMIDPHGAVTFWNPAAEGIFGWAAGEVIGRPLQDFLLPERHRAAHVAGFERFQRAEAVPLIGGARELAALTRDGREIPVELSLSATVIDGRRYALGIVRDIAERLAAKRALESKLAELQALNQQLEEAQGQLLQSEKMASIGQLAAGVAHEINNPIGFVNSNLNALKGYCQQLLDLVAAYDQETRRLAEADAGLARALAEARESCELEYLREDLPLLLKESEDGLARVKKIVLDLKSFSHIDQSEWALADINAGLESTLNVVWNEIKYKARVDKHFGELPPVRCLGGQVNQVFMNLLVNAAQAMDPGQGLGLITITTGVSADGNDVWVEVRDTGKGMTDEVRRRVFEPFFTTKPVGKGTGLGMSLAFGIVKKHQGRIEVDSVLGEGTCFRVTLPVAGPESVEEGPTP